MLHTQSLRTSCRARARRRSLTKAITVALIASAALTTIDNSVSNATPIVSAPQKSPIKQTPPDQTIVRKIQEAQDRANKTGAPVKALTTNGYDLYAMPNGPTRVVRQGENPNDQVHPNTVCGTAVSAAVYALGAGVLAAAALTGGLEIAGVFIGPEVLNLLAAASASMSGIESIVAQYVC